jgi:hypothetical protein
MSAIGLKFIHAFDDRIDWKLTLASWEIYQGGEGGNAYVATGAL